MRTLEKALKKKGPDVILIHSPHWQTVVGHHFLGLESYEGLSVDPIFPHLFQYDYKMKVDVDLSLAIMEEAKKDGLTTKVVENPDFRIDYGAITSLHLVNPKWDIPVVQISSNNSPYYFSTEYGLEQMAILGKATRKAIEKSGKKVLLLASNSLSHQHFTKEPEIVEDMSKEHVDSHENYKWDMKVLNLMKEGKTKELMEVLPDFIDEAYAEVKSGSLSWMLHAMDLPEIPATVYGYGSVIGTGNAVVEWKINQKEKK